MTKPKLLSSAQFAVHIAIAASVSTVTRHFLADHTEIEADSIPAHITGALTGEIVASQTDRLTDPVVEMIHNKLRRNNDQQEQDTETTTATAE